MVESPPNSQGISLSNLSHRLECLLNATGTILWEINIEEQTVEYFGPVESVIGIARAEFDDPFSLLQQSIHPKDQGAVSKQFESLLTGRLDKLEVEYRVHPDHGSVRWIKTEACYANEGTSLVLGMSTDITEQKAYEARLESFASVVSHDLRNPLSVAQGRLELARIESESEHLEIIARAHDRMETLIDDLLTLTRRNQDVGDMEQVSVNALAMDCWQTVQSGDASLEVECDREILADESRLKQLLENLFRNAIEHGGGNVTVTVGGMADGFYIEDNGNGIPEEERIQLFHGATEFGQSGIGLNIVNQIVDAHDWNIRVTESDQGGARFEVVGTELA